MSKYWRDEKRRFPVWVAGALHSEECWSDSSSSGGADKELLALQPRKETFFFFNLSCLWINSLHSFTEVRLLSPSGCDLLHTRCSTLHHQVHASYESVFAAFRWKYLWRLLMFSLILSKNKAEVPTLVSDFVFVKIDVWTPPAGLCRDSEFRLPLIRAGKSCDSRQTDRQLVGTARDVADFLVWKVGPSCVRRLELCWKPPGSCHVFTHFVLIAFNLLIYMSLLCKCMFYLFAPHHSFIVWDEYVMVVLVMIMILNHLWNFL